MFEGVVNQLESARQSRRRAGMLPFALALHGLALAGVAVAQLWAVEQLPEPVIMGTLVLVPQPPAPPRGNLPANPHDRHPQGRRTRQPDMVSPRDVPGVVPTPPPGADDEDGTDDGVDGGVPGGIGGGDPQPVDGGVPGPTARPAEGLRGPVAVGGEVVAPVLLHRVDPPYPEPARLARRQGDVVIEAVLDTEGRVTAERLVRDGVGFGAAEAALRAVSAWRYRPATRHGKPVSVYLTITVAFRIA